MKKPKSEARLRFEKVDNAKMKKHFKALDSEVEKLRKQYRSGGYDEGYR